MTSIFVHGVIMANNQINGVSNYAVAFIISFFLFMVFLPELLWLSSNNYRQWITSGIEDGNGILNKSDLKDAAIIYVSLWAMRIFMGFSVAMMFGVEIPTVNYLSALFGSFGIAGLTVVKGALVKHV